MDISVLNYVIIPYILFGLILIIAIAIKWRKMLKLLPSDTDIKTTLANLQEKNRLSERYSKIFGIWLLGFCLVVLNLSISFAAELGAKIINPNSITCMVFMIMTIIFLIKK
jgi:hypothetical protein